MSQNLQVRIITPTSVLLDKQASMVTIPGSDGEFGVLPMHAPLIASLKPGLIKISSLPKEIEYFIYNGIARVDHKGVDIITEFAVDLTDTKKDELLEKIKTLKDNIDKQAIEVTINQLKQDLARFEALISYL